MYRYALVTGASSGIGFEYAVVLAEKGYNLIIVSNEEEINAKAAQLQKRFPERDITPLVIDLGKQDAAKELFSWCQKRQITVEVLINNAGVYHDKDFLDDSAGFTELILNLHIHTPVMLQYYFAQEMVKRHRGYILNMSSVTSNYGIQRMSTYSTTKGFLRLFSRSTYIELRDKGVIVTCVRPGAVATPLYNLDEKAIKSGLAIGAIVTPRHLAEQGIKALFKGKHEITPGFFTKILDLVPLIPVPIMRLIRKWNLF